MKSESFRLSILVIIMLLIGIFSDTQPAFAAPFPCSNVSQIPTVECEALVTLFNTTDGPNWENDSGWPINDVPCSWDGVICGSGHVTRLFMNTNLMSGSITAELGNLPNLTGLFLRTNQLSGSMPAPITLDASGSFDPDGDIVLYEWDTDIDGEYDDSTGVSTEVVFDTSGDYILGLRVTDDGGAMDTDTADLSVLTVVTTFAVNSTIDAVDADPGNGVCDDGAGDCTLRAAIMEANALPGPDTIDVPSGTYNLTIFGANEDASATGDLDVTDDLTITGAGAAITIIDGNRIDRVFDIGISATVTISGVTIRNGDSVTDGGGLYNAGVLTLHGVDIRSNRAFTQKFGGNGGGIYNASTGTLTLTNSSLTDNGNANICNGSAVYNEGAFTSVNSTISGNTAGEKFCAGPAILLTGNIATTFLVNTTVVNNIPSGVFRSGNGTVTLKNSIIAGNGSTGISDCANSGPLDSLGYNLIGAALCTVNSTTGDQIGSLETPIDPMLGNLISSPKYHSLLSGSPAIDAGNPSAPGSGGNSCELTDQRGAGRVGSCDTGAYEFTIAGPPSMVFGNDGTPQHSGPLIPFGSVLEAAVLDSIGSPVSGVLVIFSAPTTGASGTFADTGTTATTAVSDVSGIATAATFVANDVFGSYAVEASVSGIGTPATFLLNNARPDPPTNVTATGGNGLAFVTWSAPAFDGGGIIDTYTVTSNPDALTATWTGGDLEATVTGLTNGTEYAFAVTATNTNGATSVPSDPSDPVTAASADTFSVTGGPATRREQHTATLLPDGDILVAGGRSGLAMAELYDPANGSFRSTGNMGAGRHNHTATLLPDGKVLVAGGSNSAGGPLGLAELYDPTTGTWTPTGSLESARSSHRATLLHNGKVLVIGGFGVPGCQVSCKNPFLLNTAELYEPSTGTWTSTGNLVSGRSGHTATALLDGTVLVAGSLIDGTPFATAELYDSSTGLFSPTGGMTGARGFHTATLLQDGTVLVAGGNIGGGSGLTPKISSAELYNPSAGTWTPTGSMATGRDFHTATLLLNGKVLVTGGGCCNAGALDSAEVYDPSNDTFTNRPTGGMGTDRKSHTATRLKNGRVLVAGGPVPGGASRSAELYYPGVPDPPIDVTATAGLYRAAVTWEAPAIDGGSPITVYTVISDPENLVATSTPPTLIASVRDLTFGIAYSFFVSATNINGTSDLSSPSNAIMPLAPDLSVTKEGSSDPVSAGDTLTYALRVENLGTASTTGVTLTDKLPTSLAFHSVVPEGICGESGGTVTCNFGVMVPGAMALSTLVVVVQSTPDATISNTASVSGNETDLDLSNNSATKITPTVGLADISVVTNGSPDPVTAGGVLTYTITVINNGPSDATNVVVIDDLPSDVKTPLDENINAPAGVSCDIIEVFGEIICDVGNLANGQSVTITIQAEVDEAPPRVLENTVMAQADQFDPDESNNKSVVQTTVPAGGGLPDLTVSVLGLPDPVVPGELLVYQIFVENLGLGDATDVVIEGVLPDSATLTMASKGCAPHPDDIDAVICNLDDLPAGKDAAVFLIVQVEETAPPVLETQVFVDSDEPDADESNNSDTDLVDVIPASENIPDLEVTKTGPTSATIGDTITYEVTVENIGAGDATGVMVSDTLVTTPDSLTILSTTPPCTSSGGLIECDIGALNAGQSFTFKTDVRIESQAPVLIENRVIVEASEFEETEGNNIAQVETEIVGGQSLPDLELIISGPVSPVSIGDTITYNMQVINIGQGDASGVLLLDFLPLGVDFLSAIGCTVDLTVFPDLIFCEPGPIAAGESVTVSVEVEVNSDALSLLINEAEVFADQLENDYENNEDFSETQVADGAVLPDLVVQKTDLTDPVRPGDLLTYQIDVSNIGLGTATDVELEDTLPMGLTFLSSFVDTPTFVTTCDLDEDGLILCELGNLLPNEEAVVNITVSVNSDATGVLENTAEAFSREPDFDVSNDFDAEQTRVLNVLNEKTEGVEEGSDTTAELGDDVKVEIPQDSVILPSEFRGSTVSIVLELVDRDSAPDAPADRTFDRVVLITTLVNGVEMEVSFSEESKARLVLPLSQSLIDQVDGQTGLLNIMVFDKVLEQWIDLPTVFEPGPAPGQIVAERNVFSIFALGILPAPTQPPPPPDGGGGGGGGGARINPTTAFRPESLTFFAVEGGDNPPSQLLEVWTSKNRSVLRFEVFTDSPWIDVDPLDEISDDPGDKEDIEVTVDPSGLSAGSYTGSLTIDGRRATNGDQVIPVTLIVEKAVAVGGVRESVRRQESTDFATPNGRVRILIPAAALDDSDDRRIQVEVQVLDVESVPAPPEDTVFVRAIEVHTVVDGEVMAIDYAEPVELTFILEPEDLDLVDGDTSLLGILWLNTDTNEWEALPTTYDPNPEPFGKLVAQLNHFSTYAVGVVLPKEEAPVPMATATPEPTATPAPEPTSTAVPEPVETTTAVATATALPATPMSVVIAQAPTPVPTTPPQPTATATPPALAIAVAPAPSATPPPAPELVTLPEENGGIGGTTIAILAVLVIAIMAGGYGVLQAYNRRRPA